MGEFVEGDGTGAVADFVAPQSLSGRSGAEMTKRHEAAEIAVALGVGSEKNNR